jgi:hypothetical protein
MVARARVLPDAVVIPVTATGEVSIAQALLRLLDTIAPREKVAAQADGDAPRTEAPATAQVPSAG